MLELGTAVGEPLTMLVATKRRDLSTDQGFAMGNILRDHDTCLRSRGGTVR